MAHEFFDELRSPNCKLPSSNPMPILFDFSEQELSIEPHLNAKLIPQHLNIAVSTSSAGTTTLSNTSSTTVQSTNNNLTTNTAVDQTSSLNEPFSQKATITPQKTSKEIEGSLTDK